MSNSDQRRSEASHPSGIDAEAWIAAQRSTEFAALRRRLRSFVFPISVLFLAWYLVYVLLADYAPEFMSIPLWGTVNVGLVFGLLQFVSTFAITAWYVHYANKHLDPVAERIKASLESAPEAVPGQPTEPDRASTSADQPRVQAEAGGEVQR